MLKDMLRDLATNLCPRTEQSAQANCCIQRSGSQQEDSARDSDMLQELAAFAVLRRSAYPMAEF